MDEVQGEVQEVQGAEQVADAAPASVEGADTGTGNEAAGADSITLDTDGNLSIPDSVVNEDLAMAGHKLDPQQDTPIQQAQPTPPVEPYTPQQLAQAFMTNQVDPARMPQHMTEYYKAIADEQMRMQQLQQVARPPVPIQQVQPPQPPQMQIQPLRLTPEMFKELQDGSKVLASKYLGIKPEDFNEYEPNHASAYNIAMQDLKAKANEIYVQNQQQQLAVANRTYQQQAQQYGQYVQAVRARQLQGMVQEWSKNPSWKDIDQNFYPKWFDGLPPQHKQLVSGVLQRGNTDQVKKVMEVVVSAYNASKGKQAPATQRARPPVIMSGGGEADMREVKGQADASGLEGMTPDERAQWFINNKFV